MAKKCKHEHGAAIEILAPWVCGQCYEKLHERPKRYGARGLTIVGDADCLPPPPQQIVWQAEVRKSAEGTSLKTFLEAVARRFERRGGIENRAEAMELALEAMKVQGIEFSDPDQDWSRLSAVDVADEEMQYWDYETAVSN